MRLFSLLCIGFLLNSVMAQKVTVSPEIILRDDYSFSLLGKVEDKILLIRNKGFSQSLSIFNESLGFVQEIPLEFEDRKINLIGFVTSEYDFNTYYSYKSGTTEYIKSVKMSASGEKYFEDTIKIRENAFLSEYYSIEGSEDDHYIVVYNTIEDSKLLIMLYDNREMELKFESLIDLQGINMSRDFKGLSVSNSGNIALLFEKYNTLFRKDAHHFRLVNISLQGLFSEQKIDLSGKYSVDTKIICDNTKDRFQIVGLYSEKLENVSQGYYIYTQSSYQLDNEKSKNFDCVAFSSEMLDLISLSSKKSDDGLEDYAIYEVITRQDGGVVLILEANKEYFRAVNSPGAIRGSAFGSGITDYYNEDILVMSVNPDKSLEWNTILPKKQYSQDDDGAFSSFFVFKTPSLLRFIYNDEIKNNNTVSEYVVNPAGVFERNSLLSTAYQKLKLRIRSSIQISSNSYILTSERNNRLNLVKIEY